MKNRIVDVRTRTADQVEFAHLREYVEVAKNTLVSKKCLVQRVIERVCGKNHVVTSTESTLDDDQISAVCVEPSEDEETLRRLRKLK